MRANRTHGVLLQWDSVLLDNLGSHQKNGHTQIFILWRQEN